ncbi:flagellar hook-associated protein FlgK [Halobacillus salinus]|uniref:flagellar hook-associated protein FlgK n=1 Tax=Halobacillus salinus TaxID=192814 RepID=UPI0009A565DC|nr:flagellar hook-associated protein FlgK [Halobacillus salinus]
MVSTFNGLEIAKRGLFTQQSALYTTGHNISNANTEGYTRQRVNFEQTAPFPPASRNRPEIPGQVGSGVQAGSVERVRESFLDIQFRNENKKTGYYESMSKALTKMEEIMNEPSDQGLSKTMDRFWQSLQDMSVNPEDAGARSVVRQRGIAVAETFNYLSTSIQGMQKDTQNEMSVVTKEINSLATQINSLNKQIGEVEPHGMLPNDLYDERDRLVDQLSGLVDINVTKTTSSSSALQKAEGLYTIEIVGGDQQSLFTNGAGDSVPLVDGAGFTYNELQVNQDGASQSVGTLTLGAGEVEANSFDSTGKLKGLIDASGYDDGGTPTSEAAGVYPKMLKELDNMAFTFATEFNNVHEQGNSLNEIDGTASDIAFFGDTSGTIARDGFASRIKVGDAIMDSVGNIAASNTGDKGNGQNALDLSEVGNSSLSYDPEGGLSDFNSYYQGVIGEMAVDTQEANRMVNNTNILKQSVVEQRQSISAVSLDEEMTNMIKFQHAYNAAARNMTVVDEMIDRIINQMGRVGR